MFGVKRTSFSLRDDEGLTEILNNNAASDDSNYIYYNENDNNDSEQFVSQLEIYIIPNNYEDKKILVMIKRDANFEQLFKQIEENFKSMEEFKTISNLTTKNYSKKVEEEKVKLPVKGPIDKYINSGDIIYCDIISEEYWITTYFKLEVKSFRKVLKIEYKIQKRYNFRQIKIILLKAGISLFFDEMKNNNLDNTFNFYLRSILFNKKRKKIASNENGKEYKYEIFVNMNFEIFEELIHDQLKTIQIDKTDPTYFRFNEYSNLFFDELMNSKKFLPELNTIKDIAREFLKSQYNDLKTTIVFYNPKVSESLEDLALSTSDNTTSIIDLYDVTDLGEISNFISEDMDFTNIHDYRLMSNTSITSSQSHYKPDSNLIIISTVLNLTEHLANIFPVINVNNSNPHIDVNSEDKKSNETVKEEIKINDNPFNDSFLLKKKKSLKSQDLPGITDKNSDSSNDTLIKNEKMNGNIFYLDDDSSLKKKYKNKKITLQENKKYQFFFKRYYKEPDCSKDLYNYFDQILLLDTVKQFSLIYNKQIIEKLKIPESRNLENVDRNFFKYLQKRDKLKKEKESNVKYHKKLIIFLILVFLYFLFIIIFINCDFCKIHIS